MSRSHCCFFSTASHNSSPLLLLLLLLLPPLLSSRAQLSKEFKKAAKNLAGYGIKAVAVDCTGAMPKCNGLTKPLMLYNLPAVRGFVAPSVDNPYTGKPSRETVPFEGDGNARSLQKHVLNRLPDRLLPRQTADAFPPPATAADADDASSPTTLNSDGEKTSLVLLFTDRESPAPLYKALAHHYYGRLSFAEVRRPRHVIAYPPTHGPTDPICGRQEEKKG